MEENWIKAILREANERVEKWPDKQRRYELAAITSEDLREKKK